MPRLRDSARPRLRALACSVLLTPEIHHSADVEEREDDGEEHLQTRDEAGEHEQRRREDAREGEEDVPVQLVHYDLQGKGRSRRELAIL